MGRALDISIFPIQKLILQPFQVSASMRAAVDKCVKPGIFVNDENINDRIVPGKLEAFAARVSDIRNETEGNRHEWLPDCVR